MANTYNRDNQLSYEDFKERLTVEDLLQDMGYRFNKSDGFRWPMYVAVDSFGKRIHGDKFMVSPDRHTCSRPPEIRSYNIISLIKSFPEKFADYTPGMNKDRLVNLVCNRLLHRPVEQASAMDFAPRHQNTIFNIKDYDVTLMNPNDWENQKQFYPYFKYRGLDIGTQRAFAGNFFLSTKHRDDGKSYTNLSFPMSVPGDPLKYVGLEERSKPNQQGKTIYKGMATGSDATKGMWIANLGHQPLDRVKDVYWFESAYDAMAFHQLHRKENFDHALLVSTGGSPSRYQFRGLLSQTPTAVHHACFDVDRSGNLFAVNLLLSQAGKDFQSRETKDNLLWIRDLSQDKQYTFDMKEFSFQKVASELGLSSTELVSRTEMQPYVQSMTDRNDLYSGDMSLLPSALAQLQENAVIKEDALTLLEYQPHSGEEKAQLRHDIGAAKDSAVYEFERRMKFALGLDIANEGKLVREIPPGGYKDWNDALLGSLSYEDVQKKGLAVPHPYGANAVAEAHTAEEGHAESVQTPVQSPKQSEEVQKDIQHTEEYGEQQRSSFRR